MDNVNIVYGELRANLDITGYCFEKAKGNLIYLLKDERWMGIGNGFKNKNDFVRSLESYWSQIRTTIEQRKELAELLKEEKVSQRAIADMIGVSDTTIKRDTAINVAPKENAIIDFQDVTKNVATNVAPAPKFTGEKLITNQIKAEEKKEKRLAEIEQQKEDIKKGNIVVPEGSFHLLVIDPPWNYERKYDPNGSRIASPYPEMSFKELSDLELPVNNDCILWLWTTHAFIWDAKELLKIWGFAYKAILVWDKEKFGMGSWLRMQCEFCLLGIKGNPVWDIKNLPDIIRDKRREHSRKPRAFYEMIEGNFEWINKYCDYFSREKFSDKWECYGNETEKF